LLEISRNICYDAVRPMNAEPKEGRAMTRNPESKGVRGVVLPNLRAWRLRKLLSMRDLSERSGVSTNTINALENQQGRARFATLGKLAKGLGITPEQLAYHAPEPLPGEAGQKRRGAA
jgi:DNA-binding Xre family transcriptional regulator